jgi:hypothetical protein
MDLMAAHPAISVLLILFFWKLIELGTQYFFRKLTRDDYVTKSDCTNCGKKRDATFEELNKSLSVVKGILLVVAVKGGVDTDELKSLTKG